MKRGDMISSICFLLQETREQWQTWLFITAVFYVIGTVCFILGADGDVLDWAECEEYEREELSSEYETPEPIRKSPPRRSKSVPGPYAKGLGGPSQRSPQIGSSRMSSAPDKRQSVPDLPSELQRRPSQKAPQRSNTSAVDKPHLAPGHTARKSSDVSDEFESEGSSRSSNTRRHAGDSPNTTVPPNLDSLSESVV